VEFAWKVIESGNFVLHDQGDLIRENDIEYRMNVYHRRNAQEVNYLSLCKEIVEKGEYRPDRTGVGTHAVFGKTLRFDLQRGFPLLTSKRVFFRGVILELLWMISGNTSSKRLSQQGVRVR
jgi:thymidylate synthase